jgi:hypothetical protein
LNDDVENWHVSVADDVGGELKNVILVVITLEYINIARTWLAV